MSYDPPEAHLKIKDPEALKVLADPLRNQVLEIIAAQALTINQVAARLGLHPSKLYYHMNLLEKHGFIRVVDTTVRGNIIEKHYWLTAYDFELDKSLHNFATPVGQESTITRLMMPVETTLEDMRRSLQARVFALDHGAEPHPRSVVIFRELRQMSDEQANEFMERLRALAEEFESDERYRPGEDTHTRALTIAFYPSFYYDDGSAAPGPEEQPSAPTT